MSPEDRKKHPLYSGLLRYFPKALLAVANCSWVGNEQHHPGKPLHWDKSKSYDEPDALMRHLLEAGTTDGDGVRHSAKVAWRALAMLERELEIAEHIEKMSAPKIVLPETRKAPSPEEKRPFGERLGGWAPTAEMYRSGSLAQPAHLSQAWQNQGDASGIYAPSLGPLTESSPVARRSEIDSELLARQGSVRLRSSPQPDLLAESSLVSPPIQDDEGDDPPEPTLPDPSSRPSKRRSPPAEQDYYECGCDDY